MFIYSHASLILYNVDVLYLEDGKMGKVILQLCFFSRKNFIIYSYYYYLITPDKLTARLNNTHENRYFSSYIDLVLR